MKRVATNFTWRTWNMSITGIWLIVRLQISWALIYCRKNENNRGLSGNNWLGVRICSLGGLPLSPLWHSYEMASFSLLSKFQSNFLKINKISSTKVSAGCWGKQASATKKPLSSSCKNTTIESQGLASATQSRNSPKRKGKDISRKYSDPLTSQRFIRSLVTSLYQHLWRVNMPSSNMKRILQK